MKLIASWGLALVVASASQGARQPVPDLSGTWVIEPALGSATGGGGGGGRGGGNSSGGGLGMGPSPTGLVIVQDAATLTITQTGGRVPKIVYRLDGSETKGNWPAPGNSTRPATFRSVWKDARLVTTIVTRDENGADITFEEARYVDAKGYLIVEIALRGQANSRRSAYSKARVSTSPGAS